MITTCEQNIRTVRERVLGGTDNDLVIMKADVSASRSESFFRSIYMPIWLKATGKWGSILVIIALVITLLKQLIAFIGFLTFAFKILIFLVFAALFIGVGLLVFKTFRDNRKRKE